MGQCGRRDGILRPIGGRYDRIDQSVRVLNGDGRVRAGGENIGRILSHGVFEERWYGTGGGL